MSQGVPTSDLIEGSAQEPEVTGNIDELTALLTKDDPEPEPEAETPEPEAVPEWIHEPTGKVFDNELELLRYESGAKSNQIGELRAQVEMVDKLTANGAGDEPNNAPQLTQEQMEKNLLKLAFPNVPDEQLADPAYRQIAKGMENLIGAYDGVVGERLSKLQAKLDQFEAASNEQTALTSSGIDMAQYQNALEKHPYLKGLAPKERLAVIADLSKGSGKEPQNALRNALQPNPANHVEGSDSTGALSHTDKEAEETFAKSLDGKDRDFLRALGQATASAGQLPWLQD